MPSTERMLPASFTPDQQESLFAEIIRIYDLADNVMEAVAKEGVTNRAVQLELAKPFITQVTNSVNILTALYTEVVRSNRPITSELQDTMETAFRIFFEALNELIASMKEKLLPNTGNL